MPSTQPLCCVNSKGPSSSTTATALPASARIRLPQAMQPGSRSVPGLDVPSGLPDDMRSLRCSPLFASSTRMAVFFSSREHCRKECLSPPTHGLWPVEQRLASASALALAPVMIAIFGTVPTIHTRMPPRDDRTVHIIGSAQSLAVQSFGVGPLNCTLPARINNRWGCNTAAASGSWEVRMTVIPWAEVRSQYPAAGVYSPGEVRFSSSSSSSAAAGRARAINASCSSRRSGG